MKYAWIAKNKAAWPVTMTCEVLGVSASGYFEHQRRRQTSQPSQPGGGRLSNEALLAHIRAIHAEVKGEYGWPRVWKELLARGIRVGKDRVQRLMHTHGIKARSKRKFVVTTDSKHDLPIAENLLARDFTPSGARPGLDQRHHLHRHRRRLAVPGRSDRPVQPPGGGLEHAAAHAGQPGDGRAAHGVVQASSGAGIDLPLGPRQPILQPLVPGRAEPATACCRR